jgi:hypothetical protein
LGPILHRGRGGTIVLAPFLVHPVHGFLSELEKAPQNSLLPLGIWLERSHDAQMHSFHSRPVEAAESSPTWDFNGDIQYTGSANIETTNLCWLGAILLGNWCVWTLETSRNPLGTRYRRGVHA